MKKPKQHQNGWDVVRGFPVITDETYVIGNYEYYCDQDSFMKQPWGVPWILRRDIRIQYDDE